MSKKAAHTEKVWRIIRARATAKRKREAAHPTLWHEHYAFEARKHYKIICDRIESRKNQKEKKTEAPKLPRMPKFE